MKAVPVVGSIGVLSLALADEAAAATPTYFDDRMDFESTLTLNVTDPYNHPAYVFSQNDVTMSGVLGETDYSATGHLNVNLVVNIGVDPQYCAGCNGSFRLTFTSTSIGSADGVDAVGFDIDSSDSTYWVWVQFADGDTADIMLPGAGSFWGVSAPEQIEYVHVGLMGEGTTQGGYIEIDNLTIGSTGPLNCGNLTVDEDEECDEGGETLTCDDNCTFVSCGDGDSNQTAGEDCDTAGDSINCDFDCTFVECGDLYINVFAGELCDDGGGETMMCDADCSAAECGDATLNVTAGEICDDGGDSMDCNGDCTVAACGDGYVNPAANEDCDDTAESATCDADCTEVVCGDGTINATAGEICDDAEDSAECDMDCTVAECGDGHANLIAGEDCDGDGMGVPGETPVCDIDCTLAECGDGVVNESRDEECDDGNLTDGDGCAAICIDEAGSTGDGLTSGSSSSGSESGEEGASLDGTGTTDESDSATSDPIPMDPDGSTSDGVEGSGGTDDGGASDGDSGCGCSQSGDRRGLLGLLLLGLAFRRRRSRR